MIPEKLERNLIKGFFIFVILFLLFQFFRCTPEKEFVMETPSRHMLDSICEGEDIPPFTPKNLWVELHMGDVKHPAIVFRQAIHESGHFKSKLFKQQNNLFGMRVAHQRFHLAKDTPSNYAIYDTWADAVWDYKLWQMQNYKDTTEDYYSFLSRFYSEDKQYITKLKRIKLTRYVKKQPK